MVLKWAEISLKTFAGIVIDATAKLFPSTMKCIFIFSTWVQNAFPRLLAKSDVVGAAG